MGHRDPEPRPATKPSASPPSPGPGTGHWDPRPTTSSRRPHPETRPLLPTLTLSSGGRRQSRQRRGCGTWRRREGAAGHPMPAVAAEGSAPPSMDVPPRLPLPQARTTRTPPSPPSKEAKVKPWARGILHVPPPPPAPPARSSGDAAPQPAPSRLFIAGAEQPFLAGPPGTTLCLEPAEKGLTPFLHRGHRCLCLGCGCPPLRQRD